MGFRRGRQYLSDELVPWDQGIVCERVLSPNKMYISATYPGHTHLDLHILGGWDRVFNLF
jgi:hypothetical protein